MNRLIAPSTNFAAVRDGRNSQVFYVDVALNSARSAAAGTALVLPISGNAFYCDANPADGNAYVHFQDTNFDRGPVPLYVSPGVIFNIPFTQVLIENTAQPGKKIRIAYGIDVDFQPGSVAQIAVTNAGGYTAIRPEAHTGVYASQAALTANTPNLIFSAAANVNGAILLQASAFVYSSAGGSPQYHMIAKATAPVSVIDGDLAFSTMPINAVSNFYSARAMDVPQYISPGKALYEICDLAILAGPQYNTRMCRYKLL